MSDIPARFEKHIEVTSHNAVAVNCLASETGLSKQLVKQVMQKGAVWITKGKKTQRLRRAKKPLRIGETVHIYYDQTVLSLESPVPKLVIDAGRYSVWNKPYGMLSQGSKWGDHCTITRWAEQKLKPQRTAFVVHRLDRAANGLIIIAHEKNAAAALSKLFQLRQIDKRYQVWVHGQFSSEATLDKPIRVNSAIDDRTALSYFSLIKYESDQDRSLLEVTIETGRKHQIRRHSAELGFPVVGDRLHGLVGDKEDLQLTAYYLAFECPYDHVQKRFNIISE